MATERNSKKGKPSPSAEVETNSSAKGMSRIKFNVGGTHYEVSESLLGQYPNSMLRKISSDTWNDTATANAEPNEIFIDRNGTHFAYVLDYMRDARVELPLLVPRAQLIADLEYLGIEFAPGRITLSIADPKDLFHGLTSYKEFFTSKSVDIDKRYREVAAEKLANDIATAYFSQLVHPTPAAKPTGNQQSSDQLSTAKLFAMTHLSVRYPML
jgi:hypothetical protein